MVVGLVNHLQPRVKLRPVLLFRSLYLGLKHHQEATREGDPQNIPSIYLHVQAESVATFVLHTKRADLSNNQKWARIIPLKFWRSSNITSGDYKPRPVTNTQSFMTGPVHHSTFWTDRFEH